MAGMFRKAALVFKDGELIVRNGEVSHYVRGRTLHTSPKFDAAIERRLDAYYDDLYGLPRTIFDVPATALPNADAFAEVSCRS